MCVKRKIWITASNFANGNLINTGYYFVNCLRYAFNHSAELNGNHHSGFFSDFLEALKHGHKVRLKNPWNLSHFNLYIARLLIISLHTYFISRLFYPQIGLRYSLIFSSIQKGGSRLGCKYLPAMRAVLVTSGCWLAMLDFSRYPGNQPFSLLEAAVNSKKNIQQPFDLIS